MSSTTNEAAPKPSSLRGPRRGAAGDKLLSGGALAAAVLILLTDEPDPTVLFTERADRPSEAEQFEAYQIGRAHV